MTQHNSRARAEPFINQLNSAWLEQDYPTLERCYHPDAVLLPPDAGEPIIGREAVLDTYRDFHNLASIKAFEITDLKLMSFGETLDSNSPNTTMCHMRFDIAYSLNQLEQRESGLEVYTLTHSPAADLQIIWRAQFTL